MYPSPDDLQPPVSDIGPVLNGVSARLRDMGCEVSLHEAGVRSYAQFVLVRACLDAVSPSALLWGREARLVYNDAWAAFMGSKHPWALGRPAREVFAEVWGEFGPLLDRVWATGEGEVRPRFVVPLHEAGWLRRATFDFSFSPLRGDDGCIEGVAVAAFETAGQVRASYRNLVERSLDGLLLMRTDGRIVMANSAVSRMFGYSEDELRRGGRSLLFDTEDPEFRQLLDQRTRLGWVRGEVWSRHRDGTRLRLAVSSALFREGGRWLVSMSLHDITERLRWDYQSRLSTLVFGSASDGVVVMDSEWRVVWTNTRFQQVSGLAPGDTFGQKPPIIRELDERPELFTRIRDALERDGQWRGELVSRRSDGVRYPVTGSIGKVENTLEGGVHYVATFADVSRLRETEARLRHASRHDVVTGLPNRFAFEETLGETLSRARPGREVVGLFLLNLDHFAHVNESMGHADGDRCLRQVAERLSRQLGARGQLCRHSGDNFFILVPGLDSVGDTALVARSLREVFEAPFPLGGRDVALSVSIGITVFPNDGINAGQLMSAAESALAEVKQEGGDDFKYYAPGHEARAREFVAKTAEIRESMRRGDFVAHYQPVVSAATRHVVKLEVLARWQHPTKGLLPPSEFIGVAEVAGLIGGMTEALLSQAVQQLTRLDEAGYRGLLVAVNLSARQFRDADMAERLHRVVRAAGIDPSRIILEITETLMMRNPEAKRAVILALKEHGFKIYMDDFGTGYSSLNYLRHFAIDGLKIDKSFVRELPGNRTDGAIVRSILAVARELGLEVVAEGIEREEQARYMGEQGCALLQGFLFAPALGGNDLMHYLAQDRG